MAKQTRDREFHRTEFRNYDRRVDIISSVELWFTAVTEMAATVAHFERYPEISHPDGNPATPDFTVVFRDGTGYVGELADVALEDGSIDSLLQQIARYDSLGHLPGPDGLLPVSEIDHLVFVRQSDAPAINLRCREALAATDAPFALSHPLVFLGWSFDVDRSKYAYIRNGSDDNPRPRGHGRSTSLETWMTVPRSRDSLSGLAKNFFPIKVKSRLVNDPVPSIYLAVLLWNEVFPHLSGGSGEITVTPAGLAQTCRSRWGRGRAVDVRGALDLLTTARLAEPVPKNEWVVAHRSLSERQDDLLEQILQRLTRPPTGPITAAGRTAREHDTTEQAERSARQQSLRLK